MSFCQLLNTVDFTIQTRGKNDSLVKKNGSKNENWVKLILDIKVGHKRNCLMRTRYGLWHDLSMKGKG